MTVKTIEINETEDQLNDILDLVRQGVEVILAKDNMPMAKLIPMPEITSTQRVAGLHKGSVQLSDDFDSSLDDDFWLGK